MSESRILAYYNREDLESKDAPMYHHEKGLMYTRTGYGRKIPERTMVKLPGSNRWRRVYTCIFSNSGTSYVTAKDGKWIVIR